jgi:hypothetical protein
MHPPIRRWSVFLALGVVVIAAVSLGSALRPKPAAARNVRVFYTSGLNSIPGSGSSTPGVPSLLRLLYAASPGGQGWTNRPPAFHHVPAVAWHRYCTSLRAMLRRNPWLRKHRPAICRTPG